MCHSLRQSHPFWSAESSNFRFWSRQIARNDVVVEPSSVVRAVAKRLVFGVPATAQTDHRSSCETKGFALRVHNFKITFHANVAIILNRNFCSGHSISEPRHAAHTGGIIAEESEKRDPGYLRDRDFAQASGGY